MLVLKQFDCCPLTFDSLSSDWEEILVFLVVEIDGFDELWVTTDAALDPSDLSIDGNFEHLVDWESVAELNWGRSVTETEAQWGKCVSASPFNFLDPQVAKHLFLLELFQATVL